MINETTQPDLKKENANLEEALKIYSKASIGVGALFTAVGITYDLFTSDCVGRLLASGGVGMLVIGAQFYNLPKYVKAENKKYNNPQQIIK